LAANAAALLSRAKERLYSPSEDREEWLRTVSRAYVEGVLLSDRCLERGIFQPQTVQALVAAQMAGEARSKVLGPLLTVELWHRLFVDGDPPPVGGAP
jgi:asparagine synthase (glutamine-hydrolysing)